MFADLHLHSNFSDGTYRPEEVVAAGRQHGLGALALTDHDTVEGCARFAAACAAAGVEYLAGAELSVEYGGQEYHLLGYGFDAGHPRLLTELAQFQAVRQERVLEMVARLNRLGIPLDAAAVFRVANCQSPGRPHVARALVEGGHCRTLDEAFERFLKIHRPAWVPTNKMAAATAVALLHEAGGLAVLAHPGLYRSDDALEALVAAGLDGLECFHSRHSPATTRHYLATAAAHGLLVTGGSDCHGMNKGKPLIGSVQLADEHYRRLRARLNETGAPASAGPI